MNPYAPNKHPMSTALSERGFCLAATTGAAFYSKGKVPRQQSLLVATIPLLLYLSCILNIYGLSTVSLYIT